MKISIIYFSRSGNTRKMAEVIANGAMTVDGIEARLFPLDEIDGNYLNESHAVIFGTPTYYASTCWQVKKWFDESGNIKLAGKLGAVFATADFLQGGADTAISTIINHMLVKGMLVYSGGSAIGKPFIHLGAVALKDGLEESKPLFEIFGKRIAEKTKEIF